MDNVFEYNEIYRCVYETADSGVFYTGRSWISQGNVVRCNYIHDCGPKNDSGHTTGVYFDDVDCGDEVFGNSVREDRERPVITRRDWLGACATGALLPTSWRADGAACASAAIPAWAQRAVDETRARIEAWRDGQNTLIPNFPG